MQKCKNYKCDLTRKATLNSITIVAVFLASTPDTWYQTSNRQTCDITKSILELLQAGSLSGKLQTKHL